MKAFKPLDLALLYKVFEWDFKQQFVATSYLGFKLDTGESLIEPDLWAFLGEELGKDVAFDHCMVKPNAEAIIFGSYYSPNGRPVTADRVGFSVGPISKELSVIGDRYWRPIIGPTAPESFTEMPLSYEYAFGGAGYEMNPTGKGVAEITLDSGEKVIPLPNIEHPDKLVTSISDKPEPQGFAPIDISWPQRTSKLGTYDDKWIKERAPAYPEDMDWTHFNAAQPDQWADGFFKGGEAYVLANMHPEQSSIKGTLPEYKVRCFISRNSNDNQTFDEIPMRIDTVCFFPHANTGVLIYRGTKEVEQDDTSDIEAIVLGYEGLSDSMRTEEHYKQAMENRINPDKKLKFMLTTRDLIPESVVCGFARLLSAAGDGPELAMLKNMQEKSRLETEKASALADEKQNEVIEKLVNAGVDPKIATDMIEASKNAPVNPDLDKLFKTMDQISPGLSDGKTNIDFDKLDMSKIDDVRKQAEALADNERDKLKATIRTTIADLRKNPETMAKADELQQTLDKMDLPPPLPRPDFDPVIKKLKEDIDSIARLKEQLIADGVDSSQIPTIDVDVVAIEAQIQDAAIRMKDVYKMGAHMMEIGAPPHADSMEEVLSNFKGRLEKGEPLNNGDFAGLNLTGLNLAGVNLSGCYLEDVDFSGVDLSNADLSNAILVRCNLASANLTGCNLTDANLGAANLENATLHNCRTAGLVLSRAKLDQCRITECDLSGISFFEAVPGRVDFSRSDLIKAVFLDQDLNGACFDNANISNNVFLNCQLNNSSFQSAIIEEATFVNAELYKSNFNSANMTNARFVSKCNLAESSFIGANLDKANFREAEMQGADLTSSSINMTDFGDANLGRVTFDKANGLRPQFIKSDLAQADLSNAGFYEGSMLKARLTSANLSNANCYGVEFMAATVGETDFAGTILDMTKLKDWRPQK